MPRFERRQGGSGRQGSKEAEESVPVLCFSYKSLHRKGIVCLRDDMRLCALYAMSHNVAMIAYEKGNGLAFLREARGNERIFLNQPANLNVILAGA